MTDRKSFNDLPGKISRRLRRWTLTGAASIRTKRLIVFITPGVELRAGGVLSIVNIYRESVRLQHLHGAKVVLCTIPGDPFFLKYTWFENKNYILDLEQLLKFCGHLDYLQLHIPEYTVNRMLAWLESASPWLKQKVHDLHLNVMLQNVDAVQGQHVAELKRFGRVTCTTAHESYTNQETRDALGVSLHRLSVFYGPELFTLGQYEEKESLLIVSHDDHPLKEEVLRQLALAFPQMRIEIIRDVSFEDYRKLVSRAKWSLTFGEGLDSYFGDPIFSGAVSFAVFNERFFTSAFAKLETVYATWEELTNRIVSDLKRLDEPEAYRRCWRESYDLLSKLYSVERFRQNLRMFYRGEYTFP